jgi:hypothetical protein
MTKTTPKQGPLYDVFVEIRPPVGGTFDVVKLGNSFRKFKGRVVDGRRLECETDRKGISKWRVVQSAGGAGAAGGDLGGPRLNSQTTDQLISPP